MRALLLLALLAVCGRSFGQAAPSLPAPANNLQGPWNERDLLRNSNAWNSAVNAHPDDAAARYQWYSNERQAALARGNGRITSADAARLEEAAHDLERIAPGSVNAHLATYYQHFPEATAFSSLDAALALDRSAADLVVPRMTLALRQGDQAGLKQAAVELRDRGLVARGLQLMAEDLLASVDRGGVLLLGGELDTYPAIAAQQRDGRRTDVLVVDARLLADAVYRERVWREAGATGTAPGTAQGVVNALPQATARPVHLGLSLPGELLAPWHDRSALTGLTLRAGGNGEPIAELATRWQRMHRTAEAGPLSWNYLVAGSVLLRHYRAVNDEAGMARTEQELRRLADRIGATNELYRLGVLPH